MHSTRVAVPAPTVAVAASFAQKGRGRLMAMSMERIMRMFKSFARYLAPGVLVACVVSLGAPCAAQEVDVPTGRGSGSVTAPTGWVELIAPVQQRVDLKLYGFYIGEVKAPSAQVDATIRVTKFLSITPSYLYYSVPASGLNELANLSRGFTHRVEEHQFRIDGTVMFSIHKFEISDRNMYVRRFLPTYSMPDSLFQKRDQPLSHSDRGGTSAHCKGPHRQAFRVLRSLLRPGKRVDQKPSLGRRTVPVAKHVSFQPSYMWEGTNGIKDLNYVMFGLIFRTSSSR